MRRWLKVDYTVDCETDVHKDFLLIDIFVMVLSKGHTSYAISCCSNVLNGNVSLLL